MAATNKTLIDGVLASLTATVLYTSPVKGVGTRIVAFSATNTIASVVTYTVHIVPSGDSASLSNMIVNSKALAIAEDDEPASVVNQLVPPGGTIEVLASSGASIAIRASGIEFT